jgi:hypothetical protein
MEKKRQNYSSGVFMYIIEKKMPKLIIPAFLCIIEKKNAGTNDSGVFICKMKKNAETIVPAFLCV